MIEVCSGDMLDSEAEAIVCTVNTKGAMGKGVALACAKRFDGLLDRYTAACERGEISVGRMWSFSTGLIIGPRLVICFPTSIGRSHRESNGFATAAALAETIDDECLSSVAVPALGCGHGGLAWPHVESLIYERLALSRARSSCIHPDETKSFKASPLTADQIELHSPTTRELHLHDERIVVSRETEVNPLI